MTDIVTVPEGDFTPGALAALQFPAALINAAWTQANEKFASFEAKMGLITNIDGTGWLDDAATPTVTAGSATVTTPTDPGVTVPTSLTAESVVALFDTTQQGLWDQLVAGVTSFRATYFPNEQADFAAAEAWLAAALASPTGLPAAVAAQMLTDDKDRITADANRAADALMAKFAGARFPMPPGALASAVLQVQQTAQSEVAASSRKITLASIENLRYAATQLLSLRQTAMAAALDYARTLAGGMPVAGQIVGTGYGAQSALIGAASQYYNARTSAAELLTKASQFNVEKTLQAATSNQSASLAMFEYRLKAMMSELQALSQMATSLFNNLHVSSGTGYSVSGN